MLLLGLCGSSGGGGGLCLNLRLRRLSLQLTVLGYMVIGVLVVALRPLARVVLLLLREVVVLTRGYLARDARRRCSRGIRKVRATWACGCDRADRLVC